MLSMNTSSEKGGTRFFGAKMTSSLQTSLGFRVMLWNGIKVMTWARRQRDSAAEDRGVSEVSVPGGLAAGAAAAQGADLAPAASHQCVVFDKSLNSDHLSGTE